MQRSHKPLIHVKYVVKQPTYCLAPSTRRALANSGDYARKTLNAEKCLRLEKICRTSNLCCATLTSMPD
eukprot:10225087-Prorocentrum_lima.AAC.1